MSAAGPARSTIASGASGESGGHHAPDPEGWAEPSSLISAVFFARILRAMVWPKKIMGMGARIDVGGSSCHRLSRQISISVLLG